MDCFYIHDVSLLPSAQGKGALRRLMAKLVSETKARGLKSMALTSVNGSSPVWERVGFVVQQDSTLKDKLASYGDGAKYMIRRDLQ